MPDKLFEITEAKRAQVEREKAAASFADMDRAALAAPLPRDFAADLRREVEMEKPALICEIKKASPSAGLIREDFNPAELARAYEQGGATCLSVLTDEPYFQGKDEYLIEARAACRLAVLRKDFMIDVWQIAQSRALGADCILLIMAILDDAQASELHAAATAYGMDILIEVHDAPEMERALRLPSGLIGINNRNLKTLEIDLAVTEALAPLVPKGREIVSESGIRAAADLRRLQACGVNRFLIGETLMKQSDVAKGIRNLLGP